ncbi:hypothetical protein [Pasteurella sp. PK-2025]|uniref:DUF7832 domain-containing protein n=1 Tax=unclassified Pasteurella TaxID=2621516 RepID=UPI003C7516F0
MKYDDQKWHLNDDFPLGLDEKCALIHMGFFITWVIDSNLESDLLASKFHNEINLLKNREITGVDFIIKCCDNKISSDDLNDTANKFAEFYYSSDKYFDDYVDLSDPNKDSIFLEPNSWDKYSEVKNIIAKRYDSWQKTSKI